MDRKYKKIKIHYPRVTVKISSRNSTNSKVVKRSRPQISYYSKKRSIPNKSYRYYKKIMKKNGFISIPPITQEETTPRPKLPYED